MKTSTERTADGEWKGQAELRSLQPVLVLIERVRQVLRRSWVATGLGLTISVFVGMSVALSLVDIAFPFGQSVRMTALVLVALSTLYVVVVGVLRPSLRRLTEVQVARRIEKQLPNIHNRLVSCIDLSANHAPHTYSHAFYNRLVSEVLERIRRFRPREVIDRRSLRRAGLFAAASLAALVVSIWLFPQPVTTAIARLFIPLRDIAPATGVHFVVSPGDAKALVGDPVTFTADVTAGQPKDLWLRVTDPDGSEPRWHALQEHEPGRWSVTLTGLEHSLVYRVHGGGTWSSLHQLTMLGRPRLQEIGAVLHYPAYLGIDEPRANPPDTVEVTGPEGAEVEVIVQVGGDVSEGEIQLFVPRDALDPDPRERVWFDQDVPEGATVSQSWHWDLEQFGRSVHTQSPDVPEPAPEPEAPQPEAQPESPPEPEAAPEPEAPQPEAQPEPAPEPEPQPEEPPAPEPEPEEPPPPQHTRHSLENDPAGFEFEAGDVLFAYVFILPDDPPVEIMLEWQEGDSWEHRAFWGEDTIAAGESGTPSRRPMGPLPPAGRWVRLEVPASVVDLEGKTVEGVAFIQLGSRVFWSRAGALQPGQPEPDRLKLAATHPMAQAGEKSWSGRFPLTGTGHYRVEMRNALGYANKPMKEAEYAALPDAPPQVMVEQPAADLVVSRAVKTPLVVAVYDDFALEEVTIETRKQGDDQSQPQQLRQYDVPPRSDTVLATLDLEAMQVQEGDEVSCCVIATDRAGQIARSREFKVRVLADDNAADLRLVEFGKTQDVFQENLLKLLVGTSGLHREFEKMAVTYAPLAEAWALADIEDAAADPDGLLDPETVADLETLRRELLAIAGQANANVQLAEEVGTQLDESIEQMGTLEMVPAPVAGVMEALRLVYQNMAVGPIGDLARLVEEGGDENANAVPDLETMLRLSRNLQQELDSLQSQLRALSEARTKMWTDLDRTMTQLQDQMLEHQVGVTQREMTDLLEFLSTLRTDFDELKTEQEELVASARDVDPEALAALMERQRELEEKAEPRLREAQELLDMQELLRQLREGRQPLFPDAPYTPETSEYFIPPAEEDVEEPEEETGESESEEDPSERDEQQDEDDDELPLYLPALAGPTARLDPRFARFRRHLIAQRTTDAPDADDPRDRLRSRQQQFLDELNMADHSLGSDQQTLQDIIGRLNHVTQQQDRQTSAAFGQVFRSRPLRQALAMSARMRHMRAGGPYRPSSGPSPAMTGPLLATGTSRYYDNPSWGMLLQGPAAGPLAPSSRRVILRMQPKQRQELLQGMREKAPEGYQQYVQDYFKELARIRQAQ